MEYLSVYFLFGHTKTSYSTSRFNIIHYLLITYKLYLNIQNSFLKKLEPLFKENMQQF